MFLIFIHIIILYAFYQIGNWIQFIFNLLIPGSVIGMILLFLLLATNVIKVKWIEAGAAMMNKHLTLFFIPVTVGIMNYFDLFKGRGIILVLITIISTIIVMISSGLISQWLATRKEAKQHE
ncbi:CidA/LrgA family holin-like protein [Oceanobacillus piezotolerans]|uniref:CidA/LrgA family holin-like protein n=1 Tax=Oceanobacillus piezotolerans TaxID=2448030 RepID=A0A498D708_9BACI|nr:CidA/LrgA family holin-like protein [Oceanobacillus piezotolerans]RLL42944.1 CidA/LrgA family holin-like protein [Oceanobacillus piezotolerans]